LLLRAFQFFADEEHERNQNADTYSKWKLESEIAKKADCCDTSVYGPTRVVALEE
jgi:hypothetical protein